MKRSRLGASNNGARIVLIKWLAFSCMLAAIFSSLSLAVWEHWQPFFGHTRYQVVAPAVQRWSYAILQCVKSVGFLAGLLGFFLVATRRGILLKIIMGLAALGGTFYAIVWIMIALAARDDAIYLFKHPIGSDAHSNGGALFLWLAPIALGVAALSAHRISRWKSMWAILAGLLGSQIFGLLEPRVALMIEGAIWLVFGYIVHTFGTGSG
jgi:hypothetical protein